MYPQTSFEPKYGTFNFKKRTKSVPMDQGLTELKSSSPLKKFGVSKNMLVLNNLHLFLRPIKNKFSLFVSYTKKIQ